MFRSQPVELSPIEEAQMKVEQYEQEINAGTYYAPQAPMKLTAEQQINSLPYMSDNLKAVLQNPNNNDFELKPIVEQPMYQAQPIYNEPAPVPPHAPTVAEMMAKVQGVVVTSTEHSEDSLPSYQHVATPSDEHIIISDEDLLNASESDRSNDAIAMEQSKVEMSKPSSITGENGVFASAAVDVVQTNSVQEPASQPAIEPAPEPVIEPASAPAVEPASELAIEPVQDVQLVKTAPEVDVNAETPTNIDVNTPATTPSQTAIESEMSKIPSATGEQKTAPVPKFLIIGSTKCSTSAFLKFLQLHPQMRSPGETYFFNKFYENGIDWYKAQFEPLTQRPNLILFEKTPTYYTCIDCPKRVKEFDPDMKILISGKT